MKSIIHVNRHHILKNSKDGGNRPVYTIKRGKKTIYAREVKILGESTMVYNGKALSCGAKAWVETWADLELKDAMSFQEASKSA